MNKYEIVYENIDGEKKIIRYGIDAVNAIERLCKQYQWNFKLNLYDTATGGKTWAKCKVGRSSYVDYDTVAIASKVEAKVNLISNLGQKWEYAGMGRFGSYEYIKIHKKFYKILFTATDRRPYIRYNRTTWYLW